MKGWIAGLLLALAATGAWAGQPVTVAVLDVEYIDTSGEVRDQSQEHAARAARLVEAMRDGLSASDGYRGVALSCGDDPCTARTTEPATLVKLARSAGAGLILVPTVQKMSTLVQFAKVQAIAVATGDIVFDRWLTFRGDTDESWRRLQEYVLADFLKAAPHG
ncbi:MAG: DUF2380 domain-containing protein [Geminicoccaceae bacterium]